MMFPRENREGNLASATPRSSGLGNLLIPGAVAYVVAGILLPLLPGVLPAELANWLAAAPVFLPFRWVAAVVVGVGCWRQWQTPLRASLAFLTASMLLGALTATWVNLDEVLKPDPASFLIVRQLLLLGTYSTLAAAVVSLPRRKTASQDQVLVAFDVLLAAGIGILLVWFYFIQPGGGDSLRFPGADNLVLMSARFGNAILDVVLLLVLVTGPRLRGTGDLQRYARPLALGLGLIFAGQCLMNLQVHFTAAMLRPLEMLANRLAVLAFLAAGLAAWRPQGEWMAAPAVPVESRMWTLGSMASLLMLASLLVEAHDHGNSQLRVVTAGAVATALLLLLRQTVINRRRDAWQARQRAELLREVAERTAELAAANARLELLASEDALTGLPNRRAFDDALAVAWASCARAGQSLSVALLDIDHFKAYNDHFGHPAGDACLQSVSRVLGRLVRRRTDLVARYGGEEFLLLMPHTDAAGAEVFAERIRAAVEAEALPHPALGEGRVVTLSIGVVTAMPDPVSLPEGLFFAADAALYEAKASGRNRVCIGRV